MVKIECRDYGFECEFVVEGNSDTILEEFGNHSLEEHGIEYGKEALMQFIMRQG